MKPVVRALARVSSDAAGRALIPMVASPQLRAAVRGWVRREPDVAGPILDAWLEETPDDALELGGAEDLGSHLKVLRAEVAPAAPKPAATWPPGAPRCLREPPWTRRRAPRAPLRLTPIERPPRYRGPTMPRREETRRSVRDRVRRADEGERMSVIDLVTGPEDEVLAIWSEGRPERYRGGPTEARGLELLCARLGDRALPGLLAYAEVHLAAAISTLVRFDTPAVAPALARAFAKQRSPLPERWLLADPEMAAEGLIPEAVREPGSRASEDAARALRLIARWGGREDLERVAGRYGVDLAPILEDDAPRRVPKPPAFLHLVRAELRLRDGTPLPPAASRIVATMLQISERVPCSALEEVRAACDPESLAAFVKAVFHAWQDQGAPSKHDWAIAALGHLGSDALIDEVLPYVNEWTDRGAPRRAEKVLDANRVDGERDRAPAPRSDPPREPPQEPPDGGRRGDDARRRAPRAEPRGARGPHRADAGPRRARAHRARPRHALLRGRLRRGAAPPPPRRRPRAPALPARAQGRRAPRRREGPLRAPAQAREARGRAADRAASRSSCARSATCRRRSSRSTSCGTRWCDTSRAASCGGPSAATSSASPRTTPTRTSATRRSPSPAPSPSRHPLEMRTRDAWGELFADYELLQPFPQIGRTVYVPTPEELSENRVLRVEGLEVPRPRARGAPAPPLRPPRAPPRRPGRPRPLAHHLGDRRPVAPSADADPPLGALPDARALARLGGVRLDTRFGGRGGAQRRAPGHRTGGGAAPAPRARSARACGSHEATKPRTPRRRSWRRAAPARPTGRAPRARPRGEAARGSRPSRARPRRGVSAAGARGEHLPPGGRTPNLPHGATRPHPATAPAGAQPPRLAREAREHVAVTSDQAPHPTSEVVAARSAARPTGRAPRARPRGEAARGRALRGRGQEGG